MWEGMCEELHFPALFSLCKKASFFRAAVEAQPCCVKFRMEEYPRRMRGCEESTFLYSYFTVCLLPCQPNSSDGTSCFSEKFASNWHFCSTVLLMNILFHINVRNPSSKHTLFLCSPFQTALASPLAATLQNKWSFILNPASPAQ